MSVVAIFLAVLVLVYVAVKLAQALLLGRWDEWYGSADVPAFYLQRLLYIPLGYWGGKWRGCRIDLHKFTAADAPACLHTHPATAVRIILAGGYTEEYYEEEFHLASVGDSRISTHGQRVSAFDTWRPGMVGVVRPEFAHRIHSLVNGKSSWSLWLRGPITAPVRLVGAGWPHNAKPDPRAGRK